MKIGGTNPASLNVERQRRERATLANDGRLFSARRGRSCLQRIHFTTLHPPSFFLFAYFALKPSDVFSALLFTIRG